MWYDLDFWPTVSASGNAKESKLVASRKQNTPVTSEFRLTVEVIVWEVYKNYFWISENLEIWAMRYFELSWCYSL